MLGVTLPPPLKPEQTARLRKALPGYAGILDDVAALLEEDAGALNLPDVTPEALLAAQAEQKYLAAREAVAQAVYRSLFEQRMQVDDRAMKMLEKIARRINALKEDDRDLPARWKLAALAGTDDLRRPLPERFKWALRRTCTIAPVAMVPSTC